MEKIDNVRRTITKYGIIALAGVGLFRFLSVPKTDSDELLRVMESDIPNGGALLFPEKGLMVSKREGAVTALSLVCTHLGCIVSVLPDRIQCPCHGSEFTLDGAVVTGPAPRPLPRYRTRQDGVEVVVTEEVIHV